MRRIHPIHLNDQGDEVSNLHKGLLFLISHEGGISDNDRRILAQQLAPDLRDEAFGNATLNMVKVFQEQLKSRSNLPFSDELKKEIKFMMSVNGDIDQPTADALNGLLKLEGAL